MRLELAGVHLLERAPDIAVDLCPPAGREAVVEDVANQCVREAQAPRALGTP